jgi:hypothetical protein
MLRGLPSLPPFALRAVRSEISLWHPRHPKDATAASNQGLRREAVPEHWFFVADIPRTPRGKVSRDSVRRMLAKETAADVFKPGLTELAHGEEAPSDAADTRAILAAVKQAWTEVLDHHSFAANIPWDEACGDSLDALRLWFRIEEILGSRLPLEALEPGATPSRLAAAIEQKVRLSAGRSALDRLSRRPPVVIFMPPASGDLPMLARLRAALEGKIRFVVIQYPGWREMLAAGAGFDVLVDAAVSQIHAERGEDDFYLLAGYSFGGFITWETARRLVEYGHRVGFLGKL